MNNIVLMLLPLHTSHIAQPLDIAVFGPLKKALMAECHGLIFTEVVRIQKAEWLEAYVKARRKAFSTSNILSAFRGAGLLPFYSNKILNWVRLSPLTIALTLPQPQSPIQNSTSPSNPLLTSSLVDITVFHSVN